MKCRCIAIVFQVCISLQAKWKASSETKTLEHETLAQRLAIHHSLLYVPQGAICVRTGPPYEVAADERSLLMCEIKRGS